MRAQTFRVLRLFYPLALLGAVVLVGCENDEPAPALPADTVEWPMPSDPALGEGRRVFATVCSHCHTDDGMGPDVADKIEWGTRLEKVNGQKSILYARVLEGYGDMPAKGGKRGKDLSDEQVKAGVDYLVWLLSAPAPTTAPNQNHN